VTLGSVKTSVQMGQVRCSRRGDTRIALPCKWDLCTRRVGALCCFTTDIA
jgi:hypothetical protein